MGANVVSTRQLAGDELARANMGALQIRVGGAFAGQREHPIEKPPFIFRKGVEARAIVVGVEPIEGVRTRPKLVVVAHVLKGQPHARIKGIDQAYGAFIQLNEGVEFDAIDNRPVDLMFALLVPEAATQEHLQLLAGLATLFSQASFCERLRHAKDSETLLQLLANQELTQVGA